MTGEEELSQEALRAILEGNFEEARSMYAGLLEKHPDSEEYASGLYISGYWSNRSHEIQENRTGRTRASFLIHEWDRFAKKVESGDYPAYQPYRAAMETILGYAADEYRIAFQEEGGGSVDMDLMINLGKTLIRIERFQDAADILGYARKLQKSPSADLLFLIAESLAATGVPENQMRAISLYRDTIFLNHRAVDPTLISSEPVSSIYMDLNQQMEYDTERTLLWFGVYLHLSFLKPGLRQLHPDELDQIQWETGRLEKEIDRIDERFLEKVRSRLAFYYLVLIYHYTHHEPERDARIFFETELKNRFSEIYSMYSVKKGW